eukprot:10471328-Karenia_brevis.AAC.1
MQDAAVSPQSRGATSRARTPRTRPSQSGGICIRRTPRAFEDMAAAQQTTDAHSPVVEPMDTSDGGPLPVINAADSAQSTLTDLPDPHADDDIGFGVSC